MEITIYSEISHEIWWFSIVMLNYQRVHELWVFFELSLVRSHLQCRSTTQWLFGWRPGGIRSGASASFVHMKFAHFQCIQQDSPHLKYFTAERWSFSAYSGEIEFLTFLAVAIPAIFIWWHMMAWFRSKTCFDDMRSVSELPQLWSRTRPDMISSYKFI